MSPILGLGVGLQESGDGSTALTVQLGGLAHVDSMSSSAPASAGVTVRADSRTRVGLVHGRRPGLHVPYAGSTATVRYRPRQRPKDRRARLSFRPSLRPVPYGARVGNRRQAEA